jgi:hypothetical protein
MTSTPTFSCTVSLTLTQTITPYAVHPEEVIFYPSPGRGEKGWFYYYAPGPCRVQIEVFNILGEKGLVLTNEHSGPGYERTAWDISQAAPGVYLYRVRIEGADYQRDLGIRKLVIAK